MDPFEHDEDDSDDKDNPPAVQDHHPTDVKVLAVHVRLVFALWLLLTESHYRWLSGF